MASDVKIGRPASGSFGDDMAGLNSLLSLFLGSGTTTAASSGGTISEQTMVNPADVFKLLAQDPSTGVAATAAAAKRAGVYGGSSYMNLNDLLSQIGTKAAIAAAPRVRTESGSSKQTKQKGILDPMTGIMLAGGLFATSKTARDWAKGKLTDIFGTDIFGAAGSGLGGAAKGSVIGDLSGIGASEFTPGTEPLWNNGGYSAASLAGSERGVDAASWVGNSTMAGLQEYNPILTAGMDAGMFAEAGLNFGFPVLTATQLAANTLGINEISEPMSELSESIGGAVSGAWNWVSSLLG